MKKTILVLLVAAVGFSSCKKEAVVIPASNKLTTMPDASFKTDEEPKISFLGNFKNLSIKGVSGNSTYLLASLSVEETDGSVKVIGDNIKLNRQGNSPNYKSDNLNFAGTIAGKVIQIKVVETNFAVLLQGRRYVENSGNTLQQNPSLGAGSVSVLPDGKIYSKVTIADDPAQETNKVTFCPSSIQRNKMVKYGQCWVYAKVSQSGSSSTWETTIGCYSYYDEETKKWVCEDNLQASERKGTLAVHTNAKIEPTVHFVDDWQGETGW